MDAGPHIVENIVGLGTCLAARGDSGGAEECFTQALLLDENSDVAIDGFVTFLEEALSGVLYSRAVERFPNCKALLDAYADYLENIVEDSEAAGRIKKRLLGRAKEGSGEGGSVLHL